MKIGETNRARAPKGTTASRRTTQAYQTAASAGVRQVADTVSVLGIPEAELTPKVRAAISSLLADVDRMRSEIEQQQARIGELEQLADQDSLTPVINRRAFVRELTRTVAYSERYSPLSSVVYIDLNGLKKINDSFGHAVGDAALTQVATLLTENVRGSDIVGRLGGDELGVLLTHADEASAADKAAHLAEVIESNPLQWENHSIPLRVATGTHTFLGGEEAGDALAKADRAMYAQKKGKNAPT